MAWITEQTEVKKEWSDWTNKPRIIPECRPKGPRATPEHRSLGTESYSGMQIWRTLSYCGMHTSRTGKWSVWESKVRLKRVWEVPFSVSWKSEKERQRKLRKGNGKRTLLRAQNASDGKCWAGEVRNHTAWMHLGKIPGYHQIEEHPKVVSRRSQGLVFNWHCISQWSICSLELIRSISLMYLGTMILNLEF